MSFALREFRGLTGTAQSRTRISPVRWSKRSTTKCTASLNAPSKRPEGDTMKFPEQCPACGAEVRVHRPETENDYEYVEFDCGCILFDLNGKLDIESVCGEATKIAVD